MDPYPGDIYWAYDGSDSKRPFVVLSRTELNRGEYFLGVPFTTANLAVRKALPNCVYIQSGAFGLPKECVAQADALTLLRRIDLAEPVERLGTLSPSVLSALIAAVGNVIGADCRPT